MGAQLQIRAWLLAVAISFSLQFPTLACAQPANANDNRGGIAPEFIAPWVQAGMSLGWFVEQNGGWTFPSRRPDHSPAVPCFRMLAWPARFKALPQPNAPFGLDLVSGFM